MASEEEGPVAAELVGRLGSLALCRIDSELHKAVATQAISEVRHWLRVKTHAAELLHAEAMCASPEPPPLRPWSNALG